MTDRPEWMDVPQGEPGSASLTLRGRIEQRICKDHLGGPCELSTRLTATALDELDTWLHELALRAPESVYAFVLNGLAEEARR